jgi:hypothetical protein
MKGNIPKGILFIFWLLLATLSILWISFTIITDINLILTETLYQFALIISCISILIAVISLVAIISEIKLHINVDTEKQKNIRDYYKYIASKIFEYISLVL